jgi:glycosyltransferase involved in cell wall biosynthesis
VNSQGIGTRRTGWICCQIGAREHYAVPRALRTANQLVELLTDVWAGGSLKSFLPNRWKQRFHPELSDIPVHSWTISAAMLQSRLKWKRCSLWEQNTRTNDWFQEKVCRILPSLVRRQSRPPVVFAYSYAATRIFQVAKDLGCQTVLGQIDPGPVEMRIVQALERQQGTSLTEWPPDSYWDDWRTECHLVDTIVVNSEWSRSALMAEGIAEEKLHIIPLAYDSQGLSTAQSRVVPDQFNSSRKLRVLFLGQLIPRKGILEVADAIRHMAKAPVEWLLVGGGSNSVLSQLRQLPNTIVTGPVSRQAAAAYYQQADVFLLPTHSDGFALTQLEAISRGLPIVASKACGSVVRHEHNGLLLPEVSGSAIRNALERLLNSKECLRQLTGNAVLEPQFTLDKIGQQLLEVAVEAFDRDV